ncbi:DNA cytosine methyltransferase [Roseomonas populi]|uniref:Cytosine-specific methyltransferase n=1 Tax=Roseomonas populi TaxID=3121582 RepID=A0ABT1X137_9PROT|nr:DNA cytosine methyltransferase [Roseomonas pecuniae]MCR0981821.1 DNA cytosine methyltransferase [Roseomonas pecuniae]
MRFGSVCSGIEAASVAWEPLGYRASFLSEIATFPRAVLAHHYPRVPLRGDFTEIQAGEHAPIDLLVGGTPCQSFSVAGLRGGLADERGNLALEYLRLADRLRPRWVAWENVPGVLSSVSHAAPDPCAPPPPLDLGRDGAELETEDEYGAEELHAFHCFLAGLSELGYGFAYRVLDAQHFGLAQRRARVFVVGYLGDWRRAASVLLEPASLRGDPAPRREAGERTSPTLSARTSAGGGLGTDHDINGGLIGPDIAATLRVPSHGATWRGDGCDNLVAADTARCLTAKRGYRSDGESETFVATTLRAWAGSRGVESDYTDTLIPFDTTQITSPLNRSNPKGGDPCHPLAAGMHPPAVAFDIHGVPAARGASTTEVHTALRARPPGTSEASTTTVLNTGAAIRRLTPRECERLQGFPDDYTRIPVQRLPSEPRGKHFRDYPDHYERNADGSWTRFAADGPRYQALGNSMAVPVMRWIGARIQQEDNR